MFLSIFTTKLEEVLLRFFTQKELWCQNRHKSFKSFSKWIYDSGTYYTMALLPNLVQNLWGLFYLKSLAMKGIFDCELSRSLKHYVFYFFLFCHFYIFFFLIWILYYFFSFSNWNFVFSWNSCPFLIGTSFLFLIGIFFFSSLEFYLQLPTLF